MGLLLIVLAHVSPPHWIHELRTFDVPLMLFVSGLAYSGKKIQMPYLSFLKTRLFRLVIPTYLFLVFYFVCFSISAQIGLTSPIPLSTMAGSFMFRDHPDSIGYVWIIRIFILVTMVTPLILWINERIRSECLACVLLVALLLVQQVLVGVGVNNWWFVDEWLLSVLGYSALFLLGTRVKNLPFSVLCKYLLVLFCLLTLVAVVGWAHNGESFHVLSFHENKYPPRMYYLLYGMVVCISLWMSKTVWIPFLNNKLMLFIGRNTLWIYFWHVLLLKLINQIVDGQYWMLKYIIVLSLAVIFFFMQYTLVTNIRYRISSKFLNHFMGFLIG